MSQLTTTGVNKEQRPFAVFDIDGTIIRWQLYHAIVDALAHRGYIDPVAYKDVKEARMLWKKRSVSRSFKLYEQKLVDIYEQGITKLPVLEFMAAVEVVFDEYKDQVYAYTRDLIFELKEKGYLLFAISGSQHEIVGLLAKYYGFDEYVGTKYERQNGHFTGKRVVASQMKPELLKQFVKKHGASYTNSIAVGDSESDISMLEAVERPIAFNPTSGLLAHAQENNWEVAVERKNVTYRLKPGDGTYILA